MSSTLHRVYYGIHDYNRSNIIYLLSRCLLWYLLRVLIECRAIRYVLLRSYILDASRANLYYCIYGHYCWFYLLYSRGAATGLPILNAHGGATRELQDGAMRRS